MNTSTTARASSLIVLLLPIATGCASAQPAEVTPATSTTSAPATSSPDRLYTASQSSAGEQLFRQVCTACHSATEFAGPQFERRWAGRTVGDLFQLIQGTMPQDSPGSRTPQEYAAVISYVLNLNGYPAGERELPPDVTQLRSVRFSP